MWLPAPPHPVSALSSALAHAGLGSREHLVDHEVSKQLRLLEDLAMTALREDEELLVRCFQLVEVVDGEIRAVDVLLAKHEVDGHL